MIHITPTDYRTNAEWREMADAAIAKAGVDMRDVHDVTIDDDKAIVAHYLRDPNRRFILTADGEGLITETVEVVWP